MSRLRSWLEDLADHVLYVNPVVVPVMIVAIGAITLALVTLYPR